MQQHDLRDNATDLGLVFLLRDVKNSDQGLLQHGEVQQLGGKRDEAVLISRPAGQSPALQHSSPANPGAESDLTTSPLELDLTGAQDEIRLGGLCFAGFALRHLLLAGVLIFVIGGPLLALPWAVRCLFAVLIGIGIFVQAPSNKWNYLIQRARMPLLYIAVLADIVGGIFLYYFCMSWSDYFFREPSPSRPLNTYWKPLYEVIQGLAILDVVLSTAPLVFLWRAFYLSNHSRFRLNLQSWNKVPRIVKAVLFPNRRESSPNRKAQTVARILVPLCLGVVLLCISVIFVDILIAVGKLGDSPPGNHCQSYVFDGLGTSSFICVEIDGVCDPIDPSECLLPFPSDFLLVPDSTTDTGMRVQIHEQATPPLSGGGDSYLRPESWNEMDGFSTLAPIMFRLGNGVGSLARLPGELHEAGPEAYLELSVDPQRSPTLLLDAETGALVPHWMEPDVQLAEKHAGTLMILQPATALRNSARYIVAVRGLWTQLGTEIDASDGFKRLRDSKPKNKHEAERLSRFDKLLFPKIEAFKGWSRADLQLAWEFSTRSWGGGAGSTLAMIKEAIQVLDSQVTMPDFTVDDIVQESCSSLDGLFKGRQVWGSIMAPSFTTSPGPGTKLNRRVQEGRPVIHGKVKVRFVVLFPCSILVEPAATSGIEIPFIIQIGHGLMLSRAEAIESDWLRDYAERTAVPVFAIDWSGMSWFDLLVVGRILLKDFVFFKIIPDQIQQSFVNGASTIWYLKNSLCWHKAFLRHDQSQIITENTEVSFYGLSYGGVLGSAYVLSSPFVKRAVLSEGGSVLALILPRSNSFYSGYLQLLHIQVNRNVHVRLIISLSQLLWDPSEGSGWFSGLIPESFTGLDTSKRFLIQAALGDSQVPTLASQILARNLNCSTLHPETRPVFGLREVEGPVTQGSIYQEFSYLGVPAEPFINGPADPSQNTHEVVRADGCAQAQITGFLRHGIIRQPCGNEGCVLRDRVDSTMRKPPLA